MTTRGIRGATTTMADTHTAITIATHELLRTILAVNDGLDTADIASVIFTVTDDLTAVYPATAARSLHPNWDHVPMVCSREIPVPGGLPRCIRVLIHWNTNRPTSAIRHVYLHETAVLRPDLAYPTPVPQP